MTDAAKRAWTAALLVIAAGLGVLGWLFATEARAAVETWERSTAYNHCWLVLPLAGWLGWMRRHRLVGLQPTPAPIFVLPAFAAAVAWLVAERLGILEGRQLAALAIAQSFVVSVLGWRIGRAMAAPLVYLLFLVPFGAFMVPLLQRITAWMIEVPLVLLEIPHFADDLIIELPSGIFHVAEACAGLRFIIASLAFGTLYAFVMFRDPGRRLIVLVLALVVPVFANGLRALGIVLLGHHLGSAEAAAADHLIYGWVFFSFVILVLVVAGLPFRQDGQPPRVSPAPPPAPFRPGSLAVVAVVTLLPGVAAAGLVSALNRAGAQALVAVTPELVAPPGCLAEGGRLRCGDSLVSARLLRFSPRITWSAVAAERSRLGGQDDEATIFSINGPTARWQGRQSRTMGQTIALAAWLDGKPAGDGLRSRIAQGLNSLGLPGQGAGSPLVAVVTVETPGAPAGAASQAKERALLRDVLAAQVDGLVPEAIRLSREGTTPR